MMRTRSVGVAMLLFGIAGALLSFGLWWMLYRYGTSIGEAAGVPVPCTQHCDGVDGPFLAGVIASGGAVLVGLVVTVASLRTAARSS
ncbi:MAG: hypothetical protein JWN62_1965 [Acidimicrobiales bacterium]|nr:hypothetical protein [Acidimicrobiales bacterium]